MLVSVFITLLFFRLCGEWDIVPEQQKIVYVLAPSNNFSFSNEESISQPGLWEPLISTLANYVHNDTNENGLNKRTVKYKNISSYDEYNDNCSRSNVYRKMAVSVVAPNGSKRVKQFFFLFQRVSFVCKMFHANEHALYVADQSVAPQLSSILLRPSVFVPPAVLAAVQKPKPTKVLLLLQDVEVSKGIHEFLR